MADESRHHPSARALAGQDVASLTGAGITDIEVEKLRAAGVRTVAQLLERVAGDGLDDLEREAKIEGYRLVQFLPVEFVEGLADEYLYRARMNRIIPAGPQAARRRLPLGLRARQAAGRAETWVRQHLLDLALIGGAGLVGFLFLRALGSFGAMPPPWGLGRRYAVAARDLKKDQVLQSRQVHFALLPPAQNYFTGADGLEGLILARDVPRQKPLRHEDLLRLQVVAVRDIAQGETLAAADLRLEWRPLQLNALLRAADAENTKARLAIRKDYVVTEEQLAR